MDSHERRSTTPNCDADDVGDQVAVYLAELTSEMVTEMKSELREMVNAVDEIISPSLGEKNCNVIAEQASNNEECDRENCCQSPSPSRTLEGKTRGHGMYRHADRKGILRFLTKITCSHRRNRPDESEPVQE